MAKPDERAFCEVEPLEDEQGFLLARRANSHPQALWLERQLFVYEDALALHDWLSRALGLENKDGNNQKG